MAGTWWHADYGVTADEDVLDHQRRNPDALLEGYGPSNHQRMVLADAIHHQMSSHAADLEELARTDRTFADLVARDFARAARNDARWWRDNASSFDM